MIKGVFKLVFGIIGAVVIIGLIVLVTFVIGHAVTDSWNPAEWDKSNKEASAVVAEYCYGKPDFLSTIIRFA